MKALAVENRLAMIGEIISCGCGSVGIVDGARQRRATEHRRPYVEDPTSNQSQRRKTERRTPNVDLVTDDVRVVQVGLGCQASKESGPSKRVAT